MKRTGLFFIGLLLTAALGFMAWKTANSQNNLLESDFFTFWLGSKLVWEDQNPYDPVIWQAGHQLAGSTWLENPIYCYPLPLTYITLLFGAMPINLAGPIWLFLSALSVIAAVLILLMRSKAGFHLKLVLPMIMGFVLFRPVLVTIRNGQLGSFYLLIIVLVLLLINRQKWAAAGLLSILLYLKPTLGLPFLGLLIIWLLRNHGWKAITLNFAGAAAVLILSFIHQPQWVSAFLDIGLQKGSDVFMITPTIWGIAGLSCGMDADCTSVTGAITFIILSIAAILLTIKYAKCWSIWMAGSLFIILTLLITPYLWAYDQILLILPIMTIVHALHEFKAKYLVISLLPLLFACISLLLLTLAIDKQHDVLSILLTIITGVLLYLIVIWYRKKKNGTEHR